MLRARSALWRQAGQAFGLMLLLWLVRCGLIYWAGGFNPHLAVWPQLSASLAPLLLAALGGFLLSLHWLESRSLSWSRALQGLWVGLALLLVLLLYSLFEGALSRWLLDSLQPAAGGLWRQVVFFWQSHFLGALVLLLPWSYLLSKRTTQSVQWAPVGRAESLWLMLLCQACVLLPWLGLLPWARLASPAALALALWLSVLALAALLLAVRYGLPAQRMHLQPWRLAVCALLVPLVYLYALSVLLTRPLQLYLSQGLPAPGWPVTVLLLSLLLAGLAPCYGLALRKLIKSDVR